MFTTEPSYQSYPAQVIRKLIDGQEVENFIAGLSAPWKEIGRNIAACPKSPTLRTQAFEASIANLQEANEIRKWVFAACPRLD